MAVKLPTRGNPAGGNPAAEGADENGNAEAPQWSLLDPEGTWTTPSNSLATRSSSLPAVIEKAMMFLVTASIKIVLMEMLRALITMAMALMPVLIVMTAMPATQSI